jgi:hypothetical protein
MPIERISAASYESADFQSDEEASVSSGNQITVRTPNSRNVLDQVTELLMQVAEKEVEMAAGPNGDTAPFIVKPVVNSLEGGLTLSPGNASFESFAPLASFPRLRRDQLLRVDYWLGDIVNVASGDDLLKNLLQVKIDFTALGLRLKTCSVDEEDPEKISTGKPDPFKNKLKRIQKKWNWQKIIEDLLRDWFSKDTMILYWKLDKVNDDSVPPADRSKEAEIPGLRDITVLNPADCDWDNSFGNDVLKYRIPKEIEMKIRNALMRSGAERAKALKALMEAGIEKKYIEAVDKGLAFVTLDRNDGDNWLVVTRERNRNGIAKPSMRFIFDALESRKFVKEGEFTASFMMKHFIFQASAGESITQGVLAGLRNNWAKQKDIDNLHTVLKNTAKAQRIATNHTVKFNYIFPPADMWDEKKYQKAEARIYDFVGVNAIVMSGQGGTNSGGYLGIKRMIAGMWTAREKIDYIIYEFFDNAEIRKICKVPDDVDVTATFDENALKEPKQVLDEVKFIYQSGLGDPETALSELGRDPNAIRDAKLVAIKFNEKTHVWEPVVPLAPQGTVGKRQVKQDAKGRPPNDGTTQSEETRTQSARAQQ